MSNESRVRFMFNLSYKSSMTENRLTGLALMHIHYAKTVDLDKVIEEFANKHPGEMKLQSIIYMTIISYQSIMF